MNKATPFKLKPGHILGLRTNAPTMVSHSGFLWPGVGGVATAPDWCETPECGGGLHFLKWGAGDASLLHAPEDPATHWLVISTPAKGVVDLEGKAKCKTCTVVYCGPKEGALVLLQAHAPAGTPVVYGTATAGYRGTATAGYRGTATAGDAGTATAGCRGTATAGDEGTATAGDAGTATAGDAGVVAILYFDPAKNKYRRLVGYVGEGGLTPNVAYRINDQRQFEAVTG